MLGHEMTAVMSLHHCPYKQNICCGTNEETLKTQQIQLKYECESKKRISNKNKDVSLLNNLAAEAFWRATDLLPCNFIENTSRN